MWGIHVANIFTFQIVCHLLKYTYKNWSPSKRESFKNRRRVMNAGVGKDGRKQYVHTRVVKEQTNQ